MIYPITLYGNPILRSLTKEIKYGEDVNQLMQDMADTMINSQGVGLAAPQIGLDSKLFVVDASLGEEPCLANTKVFINPEITFRSNENDYLNEGCLSIPNVTVKVPRNISIVVRYYNQHWEQNEYTITDYLARVVQHEYDHLHGKLHIDYASTTSKILLKKQLDKIRLNKVEVPYPTVKYKKILL